MPSPRYDAGVRHAGILDQRQVLCDSAANEKAVVASSRTDNVSVGGGGQGFKI